MPLTTPDIVESRFASQLLGDERAADPVEVTDRLLAVQAQDLRSARLAIRARTSGLTASHVDRCLAEGTLVVGWLNRGTLHLVRREDYWWLHALTTPPLFTGNARRLAQTGVTPDAAERGVATIERALTEDGPLTRDELRLRVDAADVPTAGQALVHLLMLAGLRGIALRGPLLDGRHAYVLARDWIGRPPPVEREAALRQLARPYLIGHAPAPQPDPAKGAPPAPPRSPFPDRARSGRRARPREVGGPAAPGRARRLRRDRRRRRRPRARGTRPHLPARPVGPGSRRLALARRPARALPASRRPRSPLSAVRLSSWTRRRDVGAAAGRGGDRHALRFARAPGRTHAGGRSGRRRALPLRLTAG